jgi:hypothetical protein
MDLDQPAQAISACALLHIAAADCMVQDSSACASLLNSVPATLHSV